MRRMDIEALLRWAYRDELPKAAARGGESLAVGFRTGWGGVERYGELLAVVQEPDIRNRFGLVPDGTDGEPCADAVAIHEAVERLGALVFDLPEGWDPLGDMGGAGAFGAEGHGAVAQALASLTLVDAAGHTVLRRSPARLVIRHAILGGAPEWEGERPERKVVSGANGKPRWFRRVRQVSDGAFGPAACEVEMDGYDLKRHRPHPDAYQKFFLDPDLAPVVRARAEYEIWHAALGHLEAELADSLSARALLPWSRPARPWEGEGEAPAARLLPSLLTPPIPQMAAYPRATRRKRMSGAT